jgi:hypothetical protein
VPRRDQHRGVVEKPFAFQREGDVADRQHGAACGPAPAACQPNSCRG